MEHYHQHQFSGEVDASVAAAQAMEELARLPRRNASDDYGTGDDSDGQASEGDVDDHTLAVGRRTPRQQQQNKLAQQRYRARRKAQFDDMQGTVATLRAQVALDAQKRHDLEKEVLRLQMELLRAKASGAAPLPASTPARSPAQIRQMTGALGQELHSFASSPAVQILGAAHPAPPVLAMHMSQLTELGLELVGLTLGVAGPDAARILHDNHPPELPCAADNAGRWRAVAANVALSPAQTAVVVAWRDTLLERLDTYYAARVDIKRKIAQTVDTPGQQSQWAEILLMQAAGGAGYTLPAQAVAELVAVQAELQHNVAEERAVVVHALRELLRDILVPVQAVRYLATSHPFSWNGLAFGNVVAGLHRGARH